MEYICVYFGLIKYAKKSLVNNTTPLCIYPLSLFLAIKWIGGANANNRCHLELKTVSILSPPIYF